MDILTYVYWGPVFAFEWTLSITVITMNISIFMLIALSAFCFYAASPLTGFYPPPCLSRVN